MYGSELETFLIKFNQLWKAGQSAKLDLETHAGQAWVGLRLHIGQAPGPTHHHPYQKRTNRNSPSRERHRARRLSKRKE